ncbi:MAG TPA: hypothetical protein VFS20_12520 [Longimicrobium sp.]|nr:hypothetical protein [Longimicrobium sp.]
MAGIVGLVSFAYKNSDRLLHLLKGLLDRLPAIGGAMESAGGTMVSLGAVIQGTNGQGGALNEVDRVRELLTRQKEAYERAVADLRAASDALKDVQVPDVRVEKRTIKLPLNAGTIEIPVVETSEQNPLQGVAVTLDRQIAHLAGLADPLESAAAGLGNIRGFLDNAATQLEETGTLLKSSGSELKALATA